MVELPRFELRITEPKSAVLPLHHSSIVARKRHKDNLFFLISKILDCMLIVNQNFAPATIAYKEYALANNTNKAIPCVLTPKSWTD